MITILTASRRIEGYKSLVKQCEQQLGEVISAYVVLVDNPNLVEAYKSISPKVKVLKVPFDYIYKNGFDGVYNLLMTAAKTEYCWLLFDTDKVNVVDKNAFLEDLKSQADVYSYKTYMQRGDVWEDKIQLHRTDKGIQYFGALHENMIFQSQPVMQKITSITVEHFNALDAESSNLKKTEDGYLILEKTTIGSDSDCRNLLYEGIAWKISKGLLPHKHMGWFNRHYEINHEVIDWYHDRAEELYNYSGTVIAQ